MSDQMTITRLPHALNCGTYKQGALSPMLFEFAITSRLGFEPDDDDDDDGKVSRVWRFNADGNPCQIWDYRGKRWSFFGPRAVMESLFPGQVRAGLVS